MNMSSLQKSLLKSKLPPIGVAPHSSSAVPKYFKRLLLRNFDAASNRKAGMGRKRDYTPTHWSKYFSISEDVIINEDGDTFHIYRRGDSGPLLVLLHGGGFSALTWSLFASCIDNLVECQIMAIDLRGHGDSKTKKDSDLSADVVANDISAVVKTVFGYVCPPVILVGHSMGGAMAVHTAAAELLPTLCGLIVIDVVEGTAMEALASMQSFLRSRPKQFSSLENAIEWSVRSGQIRNAESAKVSVPGQLSSLSTGRCATFELSSSTSLAPLNASGSTPNTPESPLMHGESIAEEDEQAEEQFKPASMSPPVSAGYKWRIDLTQTESYWPGWFHGLSSKFLDIAAAKLLLLAGIDRLDKELTVGQMQGKFQMQVLPQCGHAVHEDVPDRVAEVVATFLTRNRFAAPKDSFHWVMPSC